MSEQTYHQRMMDADKDNGVMATPWVKRSNAAKIAAEADARIAELEGDETKLRESLAFAYSGVGNLYRDDGELSDAAKLPCIDYRRDTVDEIVAKIRQRGEQALTQGADHEA